MRLSTALAAAAAAITLAPSALACGACHVYHPGTASARDQLLATPAPYPAGRVDSPDRAQNGRVWVAEHRYTTPASRYGASAADHPRVIYVRRDHQVVAINPWQPVTGPSRVGFDDMERARNQWLREQGYVLRVRTHVNPRFTTDETQLVSADLPAPRATIRRQIEKRTPESPIAAGPPRYTGAVSTHEIRARLDAQASAAE